MPDPRLVTAAAYLVVGLAASAVSLRIWWTHPVNRVFGLGPFVTEAGLRLVLANVRAIFALGLFALASGLSRLAYWKAGVASTGGGWPHFFGLIEMIFAVWAAACVVVAGWRLCRRK